MAAASSVSSQGRMSKRPARAAGAWRAATASSLGVTSVAGPSAGMTSMVSRSSGSTMWPVR